MKFSKLQIKFIVMIGVTCLFAGIGITSMVSAAIINGANHTVYVEKEKEKATEGTSIDSTKPEKQSKPQVTKVPENQPEPAITKEPEKQLDQEPDHNTTLNDNSEDYENNIADETQDFDRVAYRFNGYTIQEIMNNPGSFDQETLNGAFTDYISKSRDIGAIFTAIDLLSSNTIDSIAKDYIESTKDYGMFYSLQDYLSDTMKKELQKTIEQNIGSN